MFIAALLTVAEIWLKCPSMDERIKKMWYTQTTECYSAVKNNEILPCATSWINQWDMMLSEISWSQKDNAI